MLICKVHYFTGLYVHDYRLMNSGHRILLWWERCLSWFRQTSLERQLVVHHVPW